MLHFKIFVSMRLHHWNFPKYFFTGNHTTKENTTSPLSQYSLTLFFFFWFLVYSLYISPQTIIHISRKLFLVSSQLPFLLSFYLLLSSPLFLPHPSLHSLETQSLSAKSVRNPSNFRNPFPQGIT